MGGAYFPYISKLKTLKIFLSETTEWISIYPGRNVPLVTLYQVVSSCYDSSRKMAASGRGLFSLYSYTKHFKNPFVRNHWTDFNITWQKSSSGDRLSRFSSSHNDALKTWPLGDRAIKFIQKS